MASLTQSPALGTRHVRWVGDTVTVTLSGVPAGSIAKLRTQLGRAGEQRAEILAAAAERRPEGLAGWQDLPMTDRGEGIWEIQLHLEEVGYFPAKAYATDPRGWQEWPDGPDCGFSVQPAWTRRGNSLYCAFVRQFGPNRSRRSTNDPELDAQLKTLESQGYATLPPSGKLRDVTRALDHICDTLGFRHLLLLPVNPTPTTFARFGRFGSPYAAQDLTAIDPALVEFDQRTTGTEQFEELAHALHCRGGRLFLDMVINHTGWGSSLWERHPEWFQRQPDGRFLSPGAWGTVWEDLVELHPDHRELWVELADAFLTWCRRGVDGFRCDAGYKVPVPVWRYITARVRQEFPDTVFLLEGLGGSWEATEALLTVGGMQWAYSELFQNYDQHSIPWYLDQAWAMSERSGPLIHFSETHDNVRLPAQPPAQPGGSGDFQLAGEAVPERARRWSLLRNRLCALTSVAGGYAITNGVEWLATERVNVHSARGLSWDSPEHLLSEIATLNRLLAHHPAFLGGAKITRLSEHGAPVFQVRRDPPVPGHSLFVLVNTDLEQAHAVEVPAALWTDLGVPLLNLLNVDAPKLSPQTLPSGAVQLIVPAGSVLCLAPAAHTPALSPPNSETSSGTVPAPSGTVSVASDPARYEPEVIWTTTDASRVRLVPPGHTLVLRDPRPFRAVLEGFTIPIRVESSPTKNGFCARIPWAEPAAGKTSREIRLTLTPLVLNQRAVTATVRLLGATPTGPSATTTDPQALVLLTNGRGGMARVHAELAHIESKYDCLLAANLHPDVPTDRHVFVKRLRAWANANGFISALDRTNLLACNTVAGEWHWEVPAGGQDKVRLQLRLAMVPGTNRLTATFRRDPNPGPPGASPESTPTLPLRLVLRFDLEDRNYHSETKRSDGADYHFNTHTHTQPVGPAGFLFNPDPGRQLRVTASHGYFHPAPEWSTGIPHPIEASRGMEGSGDAWSPGWFELPFPTEPGSESTAVITVDADPAETTSPQPEPLQSPTAGTAAAHSVAIRSPAPARINRPAGMDASPDSLTEVLTRAARQFVVRRGTGLTVIAGYPWFLDWGRDTLIACRGLLAAGLVDEVREILVTFAKFEVKGTLPNAIYGENASNRDTSDAPLWFGVVCEELAALEVGSDGDPSLAPWYQRRVGDATQRSITQVLRDLASGYLAGTPNGIRVDHSSGLVWSPSHFTWMDTNHPAGTPREGYPVEIQALWIRLLRQLAALKAPAWEGRGESWADLARRTEKSFQNYFWLEEQGWFADVLLARPETSARLAPPSDALRSNALLPIALGLVTGERARRTVHAAEKWLLIPGALRSLAPLPVLPMLPIYGNHGGLLNDPARPYWPRYEGDEDTRRKPAYHNGTAWVWPFPHFCEALARAYPGDAAARDAARAYLGSVDHLLGEGCRGQLPEILDGDAPHTPRGCDAQAWSVTEVLRVWRWLKTA